MGDNRKFLVGSKVEVSSKGLQSYGLTGTVEGFYSADTVYVHFNDWHGRGSKTLAIHTGNLEIVGDRDNMNVAGNYKVAMVKFISGNNTNKEYAFAMFDENINLNDFVLCDTAYGYNVARVSSIIQKDHYDGSPVTKEIVCKVDFTDFNNRKEARKQKEDLKKKMDKMVKDNQELILYQAIADKNPEMATLLEMYKSLGDV